MIIGLMGNARVGKDTFANHLAERYGFTRIGLADPLKRFCREVFDFNEKQLWGDERDLPDKRYIRKENVSITELEDSRFMKHIEAVIDGKSIAEPSVEDCRFEYLTPRYALQTLGTEWGRGCYPNVWIETGIRTAKKLLNDAYVGYTPEIGLCGTDTPHITPGVVFSDLRFRNEFDAVKAAGGLLVRIYRPGSDGTNLSGVRGHASEEEQRSIRDAEFDRIINNDSSIGDYRYIIDVMMSSLPAAMR
jgi:hypothetical protein